MNNNSLNLNNNNNPNNTNPNQTKEKPRIIKKTKNKTIPVPQETKKDIARLVDYYRLRVENFDKERIETLERLEQLKLTQEEQHKMEWENKQRMNEINELQCVLSRNNGMLNKERRQNLFLQFELENREMRNNEDRRRLLDVMKLAEPIEQTYKLYHDRRPDLKEKFVCYDGNLPSKTSVSMGGNKGRHCTTGAVGNLKGKELRTPLPETIDESTLRNRTKSPLSMVSKETNYSLNNKSNSRSKLRSGGTNSVCDVSDSNINSNSLRNLGNVNFNSNFNNYSNSNNNKKNNFNLNLENAVNKSQGKTFTNNTTTKINTNNNYSQSNTHSYSNSQSNSNIQASNQSNAKVKYPKSNFNAQNLQNPSKNTQNPQNPSKNTQNPQNNSNNLEFRIYPSDEKQQIVRTIILPKEEESLLQQEISYLKKQLTQTRDFYDNQLTKQEEAKKLKDEETKIQLITASERINELIKRNHKLENLNYEITKDFLHLKYDSSQVEKQLFEELELVKLQNESLSSCVKDLSSKSMVEKELTKNEFERKTRELSNVLRSQIRNYEEQNNLIKEQYKQVQKVFSSKMRDYEEKLGVLTGKYRLLENRRNNEHEGYLNEIALIRRRVKSYEDYVYKLKLYTHGKKDRSNIIIKDLANNEEEFNDGAKRLKKQMNDFERNLLGNRMKIGESDNENNDNNDNYNENNDDNNNQMYHGNDGDMGNDIDDMGNDEEMGNDQEDDNQYDSNNNSNNNSNPGIDDKNNRFNFQDDAEENSKEPHFGQSDQFAGYSDAENSHNNYRSSVNDYNNARSDNEPESDYGSKTKPRNNNNNNNKDKNDNVYGSFNNNYNNNNNRNQALKGQIKEELEDY